jgi:hypothetical protein
LQSSSRGLQVPISRFQSGVLGVMPNPETPRASSPEGVP